VITTEILIILPHVTHASVAKLSQDAKITSKSKLKVKNDWTEVFYVRVASMCYYEFSYYVSLGSVHCFSWFFSFFLSTSQEDCVSGKSVPLMTCFVSSSGTLSIYAINQSNRPPWATFISHSK